MGIDADMFNSPEWMSEALRIGNTGLWAIEIDEENGKHRMTANETMLLLLGLETHPSPEDCFRHWYGRVDEAYRAAVDECVGKMLSTGQRYEVQYPWLHPVCGRIFVRCGGKLCMVYPAEGTADLICMLRASDMEAKRLRFVHADAEHAPSLMLIEGMKGAKPGLRIMPPLLLRGADGAPSAEFRRIYRLDE